MITIGYSTRTSNPKYKEILQKTCMYKEVEIIEKVNNGEKSLSQVYNEILNESKNNIVVLLHDDLEFDTNRWGEKILNIFERYPDYGIVGLAGTTQIPKSGMWWEDRSKMYGIVNHKHNDKKWESKYAPSLGNELKNVVIVDGLFIVINKNNIKENFDESVSGFHMYDVNFCFRNFLKDVKIGVTTQIRVTHLSIGMTNESWEKNRNIFCEKYEKQLPMKVKYSDKDKLKVLISCLFFQNFTGSEMYVFELAKSLKKDNFDVTILAKNTNGPLVKMANSLGISVKNLDEPPGYKLGDGKWSLNTPQGIQVSKPNQYYKISEVHFDIIHCQHKPVTEIVNMLYPTIDKISTIHSEVISLENPVKHPTIKKYIAIRPEIKKHIVSNFEIPENDVEVVYNPIDESRFNVEKTKNNGYTLFVGTIDNLRKNTIFDLVKYTKELNKELWVVGKNHSNYLNELKSNYHVKYFDSTYDVEKFVKNCDETAGILLGRTTIEGWMCGKPGWIYDIDSGGGINNKNRYDVPNDIEKFKSDTVSEKIKNIYLEILNKK
jgi:hypothetical protein